MKRQCCLAFALLAIAMLHQSAVAAPADDYPNRPITLMVGFTAGSATDTVARVLGQRMSERLKQPIVIENRPGQGGSLAAAMVARAEPDGYTIMVSGTGPLAINPTLYPKLQYDTLTDFAPIGLHTWLPYLLVANPQSPYKTLPEFLAHARANPGQVTYASNGTGSTGHLLTAMLAQRTGVQLTHIPYRGSSQAQTDVMAGRVDVVFDTLISTMPYVQGGQLRAIASGSAKRSELAPGVPTVAEQGVSSFDGGAWLGMLAPARTPKRVIDKLNQALNDSLGEPETRQKLNGMGAEVRTTTPDEFAAKLRTELSEWSKLVIESGAKVE